MRILIIQDQLRIGGTERQSLFLARAFKRSGHETTLVLFRPGGHLYHRDKLQDLEIEVLQGFDSKVSLWAPGLSSAVRRINPEVILCMGRTANCYAGWLQKAFSQIPVVGTLRTGKGLFPLHQWSLKKVRAILVNSYWWKEHLERSNLPGDRIHVVYNALLQDHPAAEIQSTRSELRLKQKIGANECVFVNIATFRKGKRQIDTLRAFTRIHRDHPELQWRLWMVGDGPCMKTCRKWATDNGLGERVAFPGYQQDPFPWYAAADVAVSTSREDSLPNFLVEAQAGGLPVIAYDYRGVAEACIPGITGTIVDAGDESAFMDAILDLLTDREKLMSFSKRAPVFARQRFDPDTQVDAILRLLKSLLNPPTQVYPRL